MNKINENTVSLKKVIETSDGAVIIKCNTEDDSFKIQNELNKHIEANFKFFHTIVFFSKKAHENCCH